MIYIRHSSIPLLRTIVTPYFHSSMLYKITSMSYKKSSTNSVGYKVQLLSQITQHSRDRQLLDNLIKYFGCGKIEIDPRRSVSNFRLEKFTDIDSKIIPFFDKYLLQGSKLLDYRDFCKVARLMKNKSHLTLPGLAEIKSIKFFSLFVPAGCPRRLTTFSSFNRVYLVFI